MKELPPAAAAWVFYFIACYAITKSVAGPTPRAVPKTVRGDRIRVVFSMQVEVVTAYAWTGYCGIFQRGMQVIRGKAHWMENGQNN